MRPERIGLGVTLALHALAAAALLSYEPARRALLAAAPIMVNLIAPPRLEPPKPQLPQSTFFDFLDAHAGAADDDRLRKILAQYPLRRLGRPADVVPMILLLASPLSSWTTGQIVSVNGGYAMP